jgi:hypothetical protein
MDDQVLQLKPWAGKKAKMHGTDFHVAAKGGPNRAQHAVM